MCIMRRQRIGGVTLNPAKLTNPNRSSPVSHDGVPNNAQYHVPESDDTSNAHGSENVEG